MDKKEEILKTALRLFVEYGFHATPTSKIAKEAGIANGTLFHYYKTKEELILAIYSDVKSKQTEYLHAHANKENSLKQNFISLCINTIEWNQKNSQEFYFIEQFSVSPFYSLVPKDQITQHTKPYLVILQKGINNSILKPLPIDFMYTLINSQISGVNHYLYSIKNPSVEQQKIINESVKLLWDMIT